MLHAVGSVFRFAGQGIAVVLATVGIFLLLALLGVASAFVARDYWNWFVSPLGVRPIGVLHAYGLILLVGLLRGVPSGDGTNDSDSTAVLVAKPIIGLALTWGLGWLIVTFAGPF